MSKAYFGHSNNSPTRSCVEDMNVDIFGSCAPTFTIISKDQAKGMWSDQTWANLIMVSSIRTAMSMRET